ncbi:MAG: hypothetical protein EB075_14640, partial [Bacteroidetes bacterium]|nr:hypothetical protein [Bacteroidota bacterium]
MRGWFEAGKLAQQSLPLGALIVRCVHQPLLTLMVLSPLDLAIMAAFFVATLAIGLYAARQSGGSFDSFFLGGRTLPWWA